MEYENSSYPQIGKGKEKQINCLENWPTEIKYT